MGPSRSMNRARRLPLLWPFLVAVMLVVAAAPTVSAHDPENPQQPSASPEPQKRDLQRLTTEATGIERVLIYGPTANGLADTTPNIELTVWDEATWAGKSTADFAAFDAIVFGDQPICFGDSSRWDTAVANHQVWSSAITGNIIVNGTDPDYHGKTQLVHQSVQFAGADPAPGPGLYVSLSCGYDGATGTPIPLLSGIGQFVIRGQTNCPIDAHKVADHPTLLGIDDTYLSNWNCSSHELFDSWPIDFQPLTIIKDAIPVGTGVPYTSADGQTGYVYMLARGVTGTCSSTNDADGDCLTAATEAGIGTSDTNPDTDGDGLIDSWEVGPGIPGNGFHIAGRPTMSRDAVFGPYGTGDIGQCAGLIGADGRIPPQFACLNRPPNPLRKDVYVEMDWLDCSVGNSCAEFFGNQDPLHHAPSVVGITDVVRKFAAAPILNVDNTAGISLNILIDEGLPHHPNCDQNQAATRDARFGTSGSNAFSREAKAKAVRYAWSGHSSAKNDDGSCPTPGLSDFGLQGFGFAPLPDYDHSPFGDANLGGRDILITLGPLWACPASAVLPGETTHLAGRCFRKTLPPAFCFNCVIPPPPMTEPGIFPARVVTAGGDLDRNQPIHRLIGETEADALRQLWARSFMHLLGNALGLDDSAAGNKPAPAGRHQDGSHAPLPPLPPDDYSSWNNLTFAPNGDGLDIGASFENYEELASTDVGSSDADNDGVLEGVDNCPGVWNPAQADTNGEQVPGIVAQFGDACDDDADGDGLADAVIGGAQSIANGRAGRSDTTAAAEVTTDPFPFDTDNDGTPNSTDADDDGDGVPDTTDDCFLVPDAQQPDVDGDGVGTACDIDADGDTIHNALEQFLGSDALVAASRPEFLGYTTSCASGTDEDRDGLTDGADPDCIDGDGDTVPNGRDNCPAVKNSSQLDADANGQGDACQLLVSINGGTAQALGPSHQGTVVYWSASRAGQFTVRLGGANCTTGTQLDSGAYDPGVFDPNAGGTPQTSLVAVPPASLVEGVNTIRICVTAAAESASVQGAILVDTTAPAAPTALLGPASDTGSSSVDGITNVNPLLIGVSEPNALVTLRRNGTVVGSVVTGADGGWAISNTVPDGTYSFTAVAADQVGNPSATSATLQVTVDRVQPASALAALPLQTSAASISMPFASSDDRAGVASAELWARFRATSTVPWGSWTLVTSIAASPVNFGFPQGAGFYEFYTIAIDRAGNREAAPTVADAATQKTAGDTTPPVSAAGALSSSYTTNTVTVPYTASDNESGVASVELWARYRVNEAQTWGVWSMAATATASPFTYTFTQGDGNYEFYTIAVDGAGNREASPSTADAGTRRDAADDPPDFTVTLEASKPKPPCTTICPTGAKIAAAPVTVSLFGFGIAADDRSTVAITWRLFGVKLDGTRKRLFDFKAANAGDGSYDTRIEEFQMFDQRSDAGYKWYDVEVKASAGTKTTSRVVRVEIVEASGGGA